jgi:hypothetical protein
MKIELTRKEISLIKRALIISLAHCDLSREQNQMAHDIHGKLTKQILPYRSKDVDFSLDGRLVRDKQK